MTSSDGPPTAMDPGRQLGASVARAAAVIALITIAARAVGFARTAVFARAVGSDCIGSVYQTVNTIPNIVFDVVAGGMLSAAVVPLLAGPLTHGDRERAARIASALLSWCLVALGALMALLLLLAGPLSSLLLGGLAANGGAGTAAAASAGVCVGADELGSRMLLAFAPQVLFYGLAVVLTGMLQSSRRFAWPALAPLLSSVVVIVAYLWFGAIADPHTAPADLSGAALAVLAGGTTVGVATLALCQLPAARRLGMSMRWTLRFPAGAGEAVRIAALAGSATLAAQQLAAAVTLRLANADGVAGVVVVSALAQAVFLLPWAILAVPLATSAFPRLSAFAAQDERAQSRQFLDSTFGLLATLIAVGTAVLAACAEPVAVLLLDSNAPSHAMLAPSIAVLALGLPGWSAVALLGRALYAVGLFRVSALAQIIGWIVGIGAMLTLAIALPDRLRAPALAGGFSVGVNGAGVLLAIICVRQHVLSGGPMLVRRIGQLSAATAIGAMLGMVIGRTAQHHGIAFAFGAGVAATVVAAAITLGILSALRDSAIGLQAIRTAGRTR